MCRDGRLRAAARGRLGGDANKAHPAEAQEQTSCGLTASLDVLSEVLHILGTTCLDSVGWQHVESSGPLERSLAPAAGSSAGQLAQPASPLPHPTCCKPQRLAGHSCCCWGRWHGDGAGGPAARGGQCGGGGGDGRLCGGAGAGTTGQRHSGRHLLGRDASRIPRVCCGGVAIARGLTSGALVPTEGWQAGGNQSAAVAAAAAPKLTQPALTVQRAGAVALVVPERLVVL